MNKVLQSPRNKPINKEASLDGAGSSSYGDESNNLPTSSALLDERSRLEHKIEKLREEITRNSIAREGDIEEYLKITNSLKYRPENPQMTRIRQHFEKKNRKYTQETEQLQRKLELLEQRLIDVENGVDVDKLSGKNDAHGVLHNVGHEIKRNLREMTGNVIAAPFDIAQKVKKNVFGSADNIPTLQDESTVGQSTFYDESHSEQNFSGVQNDRKRSTYTKCENNDQGGILENDDNNELHPQHGLPQIRLSPGGLEGKNDDSSSAIIPSNISGSIIEQLQALKQQNVTLQRTFEHFKKEADNEMRNQQTELVNSRFRIQHLEQTLNETMELHQNEVKQLKNDINLIGARMDYQYNDRFKKIEESVEAAQNRIYRMETSWHENSERLLGTGQNMWNVLMLSGVNIVVELLKITLYIIAVVLDSVKPLTGTRKRSGIAIIAVIGFVLFANLASSIYYFFFSSAVSDEIIVGTTTTQPPSSSTTMSTVLS